MLMSSSEMLKSDYSLLARDYVKQKVESDFFDLSQRIKSELCFKSGSSPDQVVISVAPEMVPKDNYKDKPALLVNTDFGQIFLFNFDNFYQRLTGVQVVSEGSLSMAKVNMANVLLPRFIYESFGWSTPIKPVRMPPSCSVVLGVKITDDEFTLPLMIAAENDVWLKILHRRWRRNDINRLEQAAIPILVNVSCGSIRMTYERWKTLSTGDVVVLSRSMFDPVGEGVVTIGCRRFMQVKWCYSEKSQSLEFKGWAENMALEELEQRLDNSNAPFEDDGMDKSLVSTSDEKEVVGFDAAVDESGVLESGFPVDEIPLEFSVQLGTFSLSLREACQLSAGSLLKLHTDTPGQVKIFCQNREVASGELIDVEGRLGVEIVRNWSIKN